MINALFELTGKQLYKYRAFELLVTLDLEAYKVERVVRFVPFEEDLEYDKEVILMERHTLSELFPRHKRLIYGYDMGDNREHDIQLVRVIAEHDMESCFRF